MSDRDAEKTSVEVTPLSEEQRRRQRMRSWAIAGALLFLVIAFYAATIVRLGGNVMNRPL